MDHFPFLTSVEAAYFINALTIIALIVGHYSYALAFYTITFLLLAFINEIRATYNELRFDKLMDMYGDSLDVIKRLEKQLQSNNDSNTNIVKQGSFFVPENSSSWSISN
jgi:hypothetical protein